MTETAGTTTTETATSTAPAPGSTSSEGYLLRDNMNSKEVQEFCKLIVLERKKISITELFELCQGKFDVRSRSHLGRIITDITRNGNGIVKYRGYINGQRAMVYALREERSSRQCLFCGREIHWQTPWQFCEHCYPKAETIANFFVPLPEVFPCP